MAASEFDELATILREMAQRFGETAFTDRRRLVSLLQDRLPESRRDIKVVSAAVDERVFASLTQCRPEQLGMEVERLAANLESGLGIRSDVAMPVIQACAYGLGLGPLPSRCEGQASPLPPLPKPADLTGKSDGWIGLSEPLTPGRPPPPEPSSGQAAVIAAKPAAAKSKRWLYWAAPVVVIGGFLLSRSIHVVDDPPQAEPQPVQPQPVVQPVPYQPPVRSQPYQPPQQQPQPAPQQPQQVFGGETTDFGVPPQTTLKSDVGNPTPTSVPGAHTVMTAALANEVRQGHRMVLVDSLADAHAQTIRGAVYLPTAGRYGTLSDQVQGALASDLNTLTRGQREMPIVFFCQGVRCWESYNAVLRARAAGYSNVYWYRGGLQSWQEAGLPMQPLNQ